MNLDAGKLAAAAIPMETSWLLAACMEARGKQDLWVRQKPEILATLREQAIIQSAESSNRIEGVTVEPVRLRPIVHGLQRPRDRCEEELAGYRRGLDWIFTLKRFRSITPDIIRKLHYRVLEMCSAGWHEGKNDNVPWWNFFLGGLWSGYRELENQLQAMAVGAAKSELVRRLILDQVGGFTLADLVVQSPSASPQLIKKVLAGLKREGRIRLRGKGRGAVWEMA